MFKLSEHTIYTSILGSTVSEEKLINSIVQLEELTDFEQTTTCIGYIVCRNIFIYKCDAGPNTMQGEIHKVAIIKIQKIIEWEAPVNTTQIGKAISVAKENQKNSQIIICHSGRLSPQRVTPNYQVIQV